MKHATLRNEKLPNPGLAASAGGGSGENQEPLSRFRNIRPRNFPAYPGLKSSTTHAHTHTHTRPRPGENSFPESFKGWWRSLICTKHRNKNWEDRQKNQRAEEGSFFPSKGYINLLFLRKEQQSFSHLDRPIPFNVRTRTGLLNSSAALCWKRWTPALAAADVRPPIARMNRLFMNENHVLGHGQLRNRRRWSESDGKAK